MRYIKIIVLLLFVSCIFIIDLEYSFPAIGILGFIFFIFALLIVTKDFNKKTAKLFLIVFFIEIITVSSIVYLQIKKTKETAQTLITALSLYNNINGKYPDNINELVPDCIDKIPYTSLGIISKRKFFYIHSEQIPDDYLLVFATFGFLKIYYDSRYKKWGSSD